MLDQFAEFVERIELSWIPDPGAWIAIYLLLSVFLFCNIIRVWIEEGEKDE